MFTLVLIGQCNYFAFGLSSSPCLAKSFVRTRANWYKTNKQTNKQKNKQKMMLTRRAKLWEGGMQTSILIFAAFFFLKELIVVYEPFDGNVVFMGS